MIEGFYNVTSGNDITFFICDQDNFDKWLNGQEATLYEERTRTTVFRFWFDVPYDATWYVVFSNRYSLLTSKFVDGWVNFVEPSIPPLVIPVLLVLGLTVVVCTFYVRRRRKKEVGLHLQQ